METIAFIVALFALVTALILYVEDTVSRLRRKVELLEETVIWSQRGESAPCMRKDCKPLSPAGTDQSRDEYGAPITASE